MSFVEDLCGPGAWADDAGKQSRRKQSLLANGLTPAEAQIVDEAFKNAADGALRTFAETMDSLAPHLHPAAFNYVLGGVITNLQGIQDQLLEMAFMSALVEGRVMVATGGEPDCPCAVCTAARLTAEAAGQRRH